LPKTLAKTLPELRISDGGAPATKVALAEQILEYSERNLQLTMKMLMGTEVDVEPLVTEQSDNNAAISRLLQRIREQVVSQRERELLESASAQWFRSSYGASDGKQAGFDPGTATVNLMLPLLLDNNSWKVFVYFLQIQNDISETGQNAEQEVIARTRQIVRAHQETKNTVAERKRSAERLSQLASIIEFSSDAIVIFTLDGTIVSWNHGAETLYGYNAGEVLGRARSILLPQGQPDDLPEMVSTLKRGEQTARYETVQRRKEGRLIEVSMAMSPVKDAGEQIIGVAAITRDISERKLLEKQLRQSQKMEALGQLSGGITHDFNNLLTVITGYCELLELELPPNGASRKNCEQIKKAGERAASLTRQLLAFSRQQVLEPRILNLNSVILDVEKMLSRVIGEDIELATLLDPNLGFIKADKGQIEQVLMNLVVNARDAMPSGGRLTISTANATVDEVFARYHPPQQPGEYVRLSVRDTGIGMNAETQARIFEPFFTTKDVGRGTGLGLSTVYGVIRQSEGYVWVQSEVGQGTNFEIYLPLLQDNISEEKRSVSAATPSGGTETILLVEDEDALRELTCNLLAGSGYKVLDAASPDEAMEIATRHPGPIHLLLSDVVMPGMNGPNLAQKLAAIRPEMKVVYMSGYTGFRHGQGPEANAILLPKPFKRETLLRKLHDALRLDGQSRLA
jgi:two-component system cell cycle sensor histidine kinase/response regulator CckA